MKKRYFKKLQKHKDIGYELEYQKDLILKEGNQILKVTKINNELIILFKQYFEDDDNTLWLNIRAISNEGVLIPDPILMSTIIDNVIEIGDIRIEGENQKRGYGTILLKAILEYANHIGIKKVTGWISFVDIEKYDRLVSFYEKHGFDVIKINDTEERSFKVADILWINK